MNAHIKQFKTILLVCACSLHFLVCHGKLRPAGIFTDSMVLQRDITNPVWGWASPGERIILYFDSVVISSTSDDRGFWRILLPGSDAGGPFSMKIVGESDTVVIKNILVGDVWLASGQSNMEHPVQGWEWIPHSGVNNYHQEILDSDYPEIRLFTVPRFYASTERNDLAGGKWEVANPESVARFPSIPWFFGKELHKRVAVPVGIICSSWGGTPISAWMDRNSLENFGDSLKLPLIPEKVDDRMLTGEVTASIEKNRIYRNRISYPRKGLPEEISSRNFSDASWDSVGMSPDCKFRGNIVWLRKKMVLPADFFRKKLKLSLGYLNRQSHVYLNGHEVGYFQYPKPAMTIIPEGILRPGENVLTVRLAHFGGGPRIFGNKEEFSITDQEHTLLFNLSEEWKANDQIEMAELDGLGFPATPASLFNGMIAPVIPYGLKGFLWYQGESDTGRPFLYEKMFRQLITGWRLRWNQGELPFLFFQISNISHSHGIHPKTDSWCLLREAQQKALSLPNTGMVVTVDIGDPLDVHPRNKQEFAHRLVLQALKTGYKKEVVADGPSVESFQLKEDTVIIRMISPGSSLKYSQQESQAGFEIAGKDNIFHDAEAFISNGWIYVFSGKVKKPFSVRYAWSDNPRCTLFNMEGLPATPFRLEVGR